MKRKKSAKNNEVWRTVMIGVSVVLFWRGTWGLMDIYLFPDSKAAGYILSIVLGLCLLFLINKHHLKDLG